MGVEVDTVAQATVAHVPGSRGRLITIEGVDGAGKSTLAAGIADATPGLTLLREPGGVAMAERVRELVKDPALEIAPAAEALLFAAARAQLVTELLYPALERGEHVLLDRFVDSSLAYQGAGRGLGLAAVAAINELATGGLEPDLTLYVRVPAAVAAARREGADRLEQGGEQFFATVAEAYEKIAAGRPDRVRVLDGSVPPGEVLAAGLRIVQQVLRQS